jgi:hypothetical protein
VADVVSIAPAGEGNRRAAARVGSCDARISGDRRAGSSAGVAAVALPSRSRCRGWGVAAGMKMRMGEAPPR